MILENKDILTRFTKAFPKFYINRNLEAIIYPRINSCVLLSGVHTEIDLIAKIIEFLSRDACKGSETSTAYHLDGINAFLGTSFSKDEMRQIYVYLGNGVNHEKTLRFIFSGYDLSVLTEETPCAMSETIQFSVIDTTTGKDPDLRSIVLNEDWAKHLMYCDMEGFAIEQDGTLLLLDECGQFAYCPEGRFKVILEGSR